MKDIQSFHIVKQVIIDRLVHTYQVLEYILGFSKRREKRAKHATLQRNAVTSNAG